jgi:hypothetical protein
MPAQSRPSETERDYETLSLQLSGRLDGADELITRLMSRTGDDHLTLQIDNKPYVLRLARPVVITVHGIRTHARWQKELDSCLANADFVPESLDYGWFSALLFVFKSQRDKKVQWFRDKYQDLSAMYPGTVPSVIAHSFGTYIISKAIREYRPIIKFDRVILCGSIVQEDLPWSQVIQGGLVKAVLK